MGKFQIFKDKREEFRFRLRAGNNQIILASEGYTSKQGCNNGIASVKTNAPDDARYKRDTSKNDQYYFVLNAANGEPIGRSEMYTTSSARDNGIESVKKNAPDASVEDLT